MTRYALVVGIAKYDHFRNLDKAATDAEAIAHLLEQHRYTVTRLPRKLVSENQWAIDPSKKLTAAELGAEIKAFLNDRAIRQEVVIYFAGHGFRAPDALTDEQVGYLATSDATKDGQNAIRMDALNALIKRSELGSLVMLLDCCHAGTLLEQRSLLQPTQGVISQKQNYCLIAACRDFERAREGEQYGIFTAAVLQGLSRENAVQGEITSNDLFGFVSRRLQTSGQEVIHAGMGQPIPLVTFAIVPEASPPYPQSPKSIQESQTPMMNPQQRQRLEQKQQDLQADWDLRNEKLKQLGRALAIEDGAAVKFQLEQQIQDEEKQLSQLEDELNCIEQALQQTSMSKFTSVDTSNVRQEKQQLNPSVKDRLIDILLGIPSFSAQENRSLLLQNLPPGPVSAVNRSSAPMVDIHSIVGAVSAWGRLKSGKLALITLIENALLFTQETELGHNLEKLLTELRGET